MKNTDIYWYKYCLRLKNKEVLSIVEHLLMAHIKNKPPRRRGLGLVANKVVAIEKGHIKLLVDRIINQNTKESMMAHSGMESLQKAREIVGNKIDLISKLLRNAGYELQTISNSWEFALNTYPQEKALFKIGLTLFEVLKRDDLATIKAILDEGFPINFQHPQSKRTLAHMAAFYGAANTILMLIDREDCDLLIPDSCRELAYDVSYAHGTYPNTGGDDMFAINAQILQKTEAQAKQKGIKLVFAHGHGKPPEFDF